MFFLKNHINGNSDVPITAHMLVQTYDMLNYKHSTEIMLSEVFRLASNDEQDLDIKSVVRLPSHQFL